MIHFDKEAVGTAELKLIETKKAILEKLRVRYGFEYMQNPHALAAAAQTTKRAPIARAPQAH